MQFDADVSRSKPTGRGHLDLLGFRQIETVQLGGGGVGEEGPSKSP
jgi:hypothetical protein